MNVVIITGRVTKDPETRETTTGQIVSLSVATDRVKLRDGKTYQDPDTGYTAKDTEFHLIKCFNGLGKSVATRNKGDVVSIVGRLHYTRWQDADGKDRYGCDIIAERVDFF